MSRSDRALRLRDVAEQAVRPLGLHVDDVTVTPVGSRQVVRVTVERDLAHLDPADETSLIPPISLDDVADASRAIDAALEADLAAVPGAGPYVLEVSSPGVERPLREPQHFRRNVGRLVSIQTTDGERVHGRLTGAGRDRLTLAVPVPGGEDRNLERCLPLDRVAHGRVQVEFTRAASEQLEET